jgi:hypothetical protein
VEIKYNEESQLSSLLALFLINKINAIPSNAKKTGCTTNKPIIIISLGF